MESLKKFDLNVTIMRIMATVAVVLLHTSSTITSNPDIFSYSISQEKFFLIVAKLLRCAVPLFFMISGKLMLSGKRKLTYDMILKKYVRRILLALVLFSIPFAAVKSYLETKTVSPAAIVKALVCNDSFSHLWYLYALISVYLVLPILTNAIQHTERKTVLGFAVCLFCFDFMLPLISALSGWDIAFSVSITYPVFYFVIGYYISIEPMDKLRKSIAAILICISAAVISGAILVGKSFDAVCSYNSPVIALYSVSIFYLLQTLQFGDMPEKKVKYLWKIDRLCFGVYLIHPVFIQFTYRILKITPCAFSLYPVFTILFFIVFLLCSFCTSFVLNLIPPLRKYVL